MSSTITLKRRALLALAEFSNPSATAVDAHDYTSGICIRVTDDYCRLAASNRAVMAVANLEIGSPDEALAFFADVDYADDVDYAVDEYILPVNRILPALKGNPDGCVTITHEPHSDAAEKGRGLLTIVPDGEFTIKVPTIPSLFPHLDTLTTVTAGNLLSMTQIALAPTLLIKFVKAGKRLGIPSPERVVIAITGPTTHVGVKVGLADWFYGVMMPFTPATRYEGTAPGWLLADELPKDAAEIAEPEAVEQLTWDFESLPPMDMVVTDADLEDVDAPADQEHTTPVCDCGEPTCAGTCGYHAGGDMDDAGAFDLGDLPPVDSASEEASE
jgi:hypothetical protein